MKAKIEITSNWVRTKQILKYLDVSENTLSAITRKHNIKPVKLLGAKYYNINDFKDLFDSLKKAA